MLAVTVSVPIIVLAATLHIAGDTASVVFNEYGPNSGVRIPISVPVSEKSSLGGVNSLGWCEKGYPMR